LCCFMAARDKIGLKNLSVEAEIAFQVHAENNAKILSFHVHPFKPWIVTAHENSVLKVWDYQEKQLLQTISLTDSEESSTTEKLGLIQSVRFYDTDTQKFHYLQAQRIAAREGATFPIKFPEFYKCNWIIVCAENCTVFISYVTLQKKIIKTSHLDNRAQNCCVDLGMGPFVAFGGSDGVVRVWDMLAWNVTHRLSIPGGHKSVQHVFSFLGFRGEIFIVSVGNDGNVFWWKDFSDTPIARKSHGSEIQAIAYNPLSGNIITSSNDKSISWWECMNGDFDGQVKSSTKTVYSTIASMHHPRFPAYSLVAACDSKLFLIPKDPNWNAIELLDINETIGAKKNKIYDIHVHAHQPQYLTYTTRMSLYMLNIDPYVTPSFVVSGNKEARDLRTPRGNTKFYHVDTAGRLSMRTLRQPNPINQKPSIPGFFVLAASSSGRYISLFWPDEKKFQIWDTQLKNNNSWPVIHEGCALDIAWFGPPSSNTFSVIALKTEETESKTKRFLSRKTTVLQKTTQATEIFTIDPSGKVFPVEHSLNTSVKCPVNRLYSGLLLGLQLDTELDNPLLQLDDLKRQGTTKNTLKSRSRPQGIDEPPIDCSDLCLRWVLPSHPEIEIDVPNPIWLLWDPTERYCLLVYPTQFIIIEIRPQVNLISSIRRSIQSAIWHKNALIYATSNTIECMFLGHEPLVLASSDIDEAIIITREYQSSSVELHLKPIGSISLVAVEEAVIYYIDALSQLGTVSIMSPKLNFYFLASSSNPTDALRFVKAFPVSQHISLAQFLCSYGRPELAVRIESLPPEVKLNICINYQLGASGVELLPALIQDAKVTN